MAKNPNLIAFNWNPWKTHIDDCSIRAISAATGLDYREVCRRLGVKWKNGQGLVRKIGVDLNDIKSKFASYFDVVEDFNDEIPQELLDDPEFADMQDIDLQLGIDEDRSGITLNEFCDLYRGEGIFLVGLVGNPESDNKFIQDKDAGHVVCARLDRDARRQGFYDTWDSGDMIVDAFMRIKHQEPEDSPVHWRFDYGKQQFIL